MPPVTGYHPCPVLCVTKIVLFIITTLFVLYLPLGDPKIICDANKVPIRRKGLVCLCDAYDVMGRIALRAADTFDMILCLIMNTLYDAKMMIYSLLSTYDQNDFCKVGGCYEIVGTNTCSDEEDCEPKRKKPCKCGTKCKKKMN